MGSLFPFLEKAVDERGVHLSLEVVPVSEDALIERDSGLDPLHHELVERTRALPPSLGGTRRESRAEPPVGRKRRAVVENEHFPGAGVSRRIRIIRRFPTVRGLIA